MLSRNQTVQLPAGVADFGHSGSIGFGSPAALTSTNLCLQSQTIATGSAPTNPWAKAGTLTLAADAAVAPDGTTTADQITYATVGSGVSSTLYTPVTGTAATWTFSCWAKAVSGTPTFYLSATADGSTFRSAACSPTSGWTRYSMTGTFSATTWYLEIGRDGRDAAQVGAGGDIYVWGVQVETGSVATTYHPTLAAAVTGPSNLSPVGIPPATIDVVASVADGDMLATYLPQSTNLCLQSSAIATSPWTEAHSDIAPIISADQTIAPDGTATADQVSFPAVSGANKFSIIVQPFTSTAATWTVSVWAKAVSGTPTFYLQLYANGAWNSVACSPSVSTWTRYTISGACIAATSYIQIGVDLRDISESAQIAGSVYLWGVQIETGSSATNYHATTTAAVTGPSGAALQPLAVTKYGTPTTSGSPYYPNGIPKPLPAASLNGTTDYYDLGQINAPVGSYWIAMSFYISDVAGTYRGLFSKSTFSDTTSFFDIYQLNGVLAIECYSATAHGHPLQGGQGPGWHALVVNCQYVVGGGTDIIKSNLDGVDPGDIANVAGPAVSCAAPLQIGAISGNYKFPGSIARVAYGLGNLTAAQLASMVASLQAGVAFDSTIPVPSIDIVPSAARDGNLTVTALPAAAPQSTNLCLQSQTIANGTAVVAPWTLIAAVVALPTLLSDQTVAPDGTLTADLVSFPAIGNSSSRSGLGQSITATAAPYTVSFWVKGAAAGTLYVDLYDSVASVVHNTAVSVTTAWQRVIITQTMTAATWWVYFGPDGTAGQPGVQPALSCYIWGAQVEAGSAATAYHATTVSTASGAASSIYATKHGTPTTVDSLITAPETQPSVVLNPSGATDWFDLGNVGDAGSSFWAGWCGTLSYTGVLEKDVLSKWTAGGYQWLVYTVNGHMYLGSYNNSISHDLDLGAYVLNAWNVLTISEDVSGGTGSVIMRGNLNGVATTRSDGYTNTSSAALLLGGSGNGSHPQAGSIARFTFGTGAKTATQLASAVQSMQTTGGWGSSLPTPTIDCRADTAGGNLIVTGAAAAKHGSPTTSTSPFPANKGARVVTPSVTISDTSQYYDLGTIATPVGSFSGYVVYKDNDLSGYQFIAGQMEPAYKWMLWSVGGALRMYIWNTANSYINLGNIAAGQWNVVAWSYQYVTSGTSILLGNCNGTASTPVTNAIGPVLQTYDDKFYIGKNVYTGTDTLYGSVAKVDYWDGVALTQAQLAQLVESQMSLLTSRP